MIIRHDSTYETLYAHMSRFPKGLRVGSRVKQSDVIGYVGTTGSSTGNHLHYEIKKNGRYIDPLKSTLPRGQKLTGGKKSAFEDEQRAIIARLDQADPGVTHRRRRGVLGPKVADQATAPLAPAPALTRMAGPTWSTMT